MKDAAMPTSAEAPAPVPDAPRFYPVNFHPEFGYFCPAVPFRQRARTVCKAMIAGAVLGAIAVLALLPRNDHADIALAAAGIATPTATPAVRVMGAFAAAAAPPPATFASPCDTDPAWPYPGNGCLAVSAAPWPPLQTAEAVDEAEEMPLPPVRQSTPPARTVQKVKRERRQEPAAREPDPRSAYASRWPEQRPRFNDANRGWSGFGGLGGGWSW